MAAPGRRLSRTVAAVSWNAASGEGGLLVRVDPDRSEDRIERSNACPAEMRVREMRGWLRFAAEDLGAKRQRRKGVTIGADHARGLPAKR